MLSLQIDLDSCFFYSSFFSLIDGWRGGEERGKMREKQRKKKKDNKTHFSTSVPETFSYEGYSATDEIRVGTQVGMAGGRHRY